MPQGHRGKYDDFDQVTASPSASPASGGKYGDFDQVVATPSPARRQPTQPGSIPTGQNLAVGAARGVLGLSSQVEAAGDAIANALTGDFQPLKEFGRGVALRGQQLYAATQPGGSPAVGVAQAAIDQGAAQREARQFQQGNIPAIQRTVRQARLAELAAQDPSTAGRLTRATVSGLIQSVPYVAAGPGGIPALAATGAAMSLSEPENLPFNVALAALPAPSVAPILRRIRAARGLTGEAAAAAIPQLPTAVAGRGARAAFESELEAATQNFSLFTQAEKTPVLETIAAFRKAGLLTGLKTHIRNFGGTGVFQLSEEAARAPAVIADMVMSLSTGRRTITGPSLGSMGRSVAEAATEGVREAKQIIRNGLTSEAMARLEVPHEINSGSWLLDKYVSGVFRMLGAEDAVLRKYAATRALEDRAKAMVLNEIKEGATPRSQYTGRVREILNDPPTALVAEAAADAEVATFNEGNRLATAIGKGKAELPAAGKFAVDQLLPFVKTPSNLIWRMLEYSPVGVAGGTLKAARAVAKKAFTDAEQRAFAQTFGRGAVGTGLIALGWRLENAGLATGLIEDDPGRRARDEAVGRIPGAILVGDRWVQLTGFAPLGSLVAVGATLARETRQEAEEGRDVLEQAYLPTAAQVVGEQPLLIGAKQLAESLKTPGSVGARTVGGLAGSFVPTIAADVAEAMDPTRREVQTLADRVVSRVPGARESLPQDVDVLGQPRGDLGAVQAMIDPTRATPALQRQNPLFAELVRLDQGISGFRKKPKETDADYRDRVQQFGEAFARFGLELITSPDYRASTDGDRRDVFGILNDRIKGQITSDRATLNLGQLSPVALFSSLRLQRERRQADERRRAALRRR